MSGGKRRIILLLAIVWAVAAASGLACKSEHQNAQPPATKACFPGTADDQFYEQACDRGDIWACADVGVAYGTRPFRFPRNDKREGELLTQACDGGDLSGCVSLGYCLELGKCGLPKDVRRAGELFELACDGDNAPGCANLGWCFESGSCGLPKDRKTAAVFYKQACDSSDVGACNYFTEFNVRADGERIFGADRHGEQYAKTCRRGGIASCTELGDCFEHGKCDVASDSLRAGKLYKSACRRGDARGCNALGECFEYGRCGVAKDKQRAGILFKRACAGGDKLGCCNLGGCYRGGDCGFPRDMRRAAEFPSGGSCHTWLCGMPIADEMGQAIALFDATCKPDDPRRCFDLGHSYEYGGDRIGRNADRAKKAYAWACDYGYADGCTALKKMQDHDAAVFRMTGLDDTAGVEK